MIMEKLITPEGDSGGLFQEILILEQRISLLGKKPAVYKKWGTSGQLLAVTIGADIESFARHRRSDQKIGGYRNSNLPIPIIDREHWFIDVVYKNCANLLCSKPFIDSESPELNLMHGKAESIIKTYQSLSEEITTIGKKMGLDFYMGAGHWHLSIQDTGAEKRQGHLLNGNQNGYSDFARCLADNILSLQCICPALFLRPSRSEKTPQNVLFTQMILASSGRDGTIKMDGGCYPNGAHKFELRMAHSAPYVPIFMLLHAIERTLKGETIRVDDYNASSVTLAQGDNFVRGKGCYFDYIKTTKESGYLKKYIPQLYSGLLNQCIESYKTFLETPSWSPMYSAEERASAVTLLRTQYPDFCLPPDTLAPVYQEKPEAFPKERLFDWAWDALAWPKVFLKQRKWKAESKLGELGC